MNARFGTTLRTTARTSTVLERLRENREKHAKIVAESRAGYVEKAKLALLSKLDDLKKGKVAALSFSLRPPADHTREYDTLIEMLELHTDQTIALNADEVRQFMLDQWDWTSDFLHQNAFYSGTARAALAEEDEEEPYIGASR